VNTTEIEVEHDGIHLIPPDDEDNKVEDGTQLIPPHDEAIKVEEKVQAEPRKEQKKRVRFFQECRDINELHDLMVHVSEQINRRMMNHLGIGISGKLDEKRKFVWIGKIGAKPNFINFKIFQGRIHCTHQRQMSIRKMPEPD